MFSTVRVLTTVGRCSVPWGGGGNIMMHIGDILGTVGGIQYREQIL